MNEFLSVISTWPPALVFGLKAFGIVMFAMNLGVVLTWVDRRQGAMIQDRVGPNRAGVSLPTGLIIALIVLPAFVAVALIVSIAYANKGLPNAARFGDAIVYAHMGVFWTWATLLIVAARIRIRGVRLQVDWGIKWIVDSAFGGRAAGFFLLGLGAHVALLLLATATGDQGVEYFYGPGVGLWSFMVAAGAVYVALSLRREPNIRLQLAGLLHPAADGLKTLFKEDFIPPNADRLLHSLAPFISFFPALVVLGVVPFGDTLCVGTTPQGWYDLSQVAERVPREGVCATGGVSFQVVDLNVGILYFFALAGTGIVGAALAGWASDNKYSLLGGLRAASQMVSYEVTLGLTLVGALMVYGTIQIDEMVRWQAEHAWGIFVQPIAFFLFFAAAVAESKRIPFDIPEGESEIVAGYFTEYSGMKFAMFFFSEYVTVVAASALMAALFLGGWHLPFVYRDGIHLAIGSSELFSIPLAHGFVILIGILAFVAKTVLLCWLQLTIRWTLPRFRYDQLMRLGWRKILPASLVNILATGLIILALDSGGPSTVGALGVAGDLTMLVIAVGGLALLIYFVVFLLKPVKKRRMMASTSSQYAAAAGGTRAARMGA